MSLKLSVDNRTGFAPLSWGEDFGHAGVKANALARISFARLQEGKHTQEPIEAILGDQLVRGYLVVVNDRSEQ